MKFTLGWLKEHLDTAADARAVADKLTAIGLEVETLEDKGAALSAFTVAYVVEAKPHPNADKLRLCIVDTGAEKLQVVCGAPNAKTGMKGVFAPVGTTIPGTGVKLTPAKIRGELSNGMLVSEREMGLSDEHAGIIELPADAPLGKPFASVLGLDDPVIDVAVTPNRQDCLGVRGIARDLAAAGLGALKPLAVPAIPGAFASPIGVSLAFAPADANACPLFVGRYVRGIRNGPSPAWLQARLKAIGLRPISALVDMTNYVTFDLGRPLHVFDADKIKGGIHVRLARAGERMAALNGKAYEVDADVTLIADDAGPVGFGGVIGGEASGCTETTRNVFIESALFDPIRTARTGRRYQIESDARYRFERGVDPAFVAAGAEIATMWVQKLCGGEASQLVVAGSAPAWQRTVALRPARVRELGGIEVDEAESARILSALGFAVAKQGALLAADVPSWRRDIEGEADLVEEVTRIKGFDAIPSVPVPRTVAVTKPVLTEAQRRARTVRRALAARGLTEVVTYSFTRRAEAALFGGGGDALMLANPISADLDCMRPTPLANLATAAVRNHARGADAVALFEVGPAYADDTPAGQSTIAAGIRSGTALARHWHGAARGFDAFDAKADAQAALAAAGVPVAGLQSVPEAPAWYHPGRSGVLRLGSKTLARFGELHPGILAKLDLKGPAVAFELLLDQAPAARAKAGRTRARLAVSDLPAVERDFAFVLDQAVTAEAIVRAVKSAEKTLIADVHVFDVYSGQGIAEGKKSVAFAVRLQPTEKTLTDPEIDAIGRNIVAAVVKATGGTLRS
jgi:phenylalanyl-tRNA synthetase beta chain